MLAVLGYILKLELPPARWSRLAEIVEAAIAADSAADLAGLRHAAGELELTGPVRVLRIGGAPVVPAPKPVRERIEILQSTMQAAGANAEPGEDKNEK
jgi:hypothetical protein